MEKNIKKLPGLPHKRVMDLYKWYKSRPKGSWFMVLQNAEIMGEVVVQDSLGNEIDHIEFPEGYGVVYLPWVADVDAYMLVGRREDLAKILEAYNLLQHARLNFFEVLENLEE